jgi:hypothetical protein
MSIENLADESVLRFYENIRDQVAADQRIGSRHRFVGETVKQYAERLREKIVS